MLVRKEAEEKNGWSSATVLVGEIMLLEKLIACLEESLLTDDREITDLRDQ